MFRAVERRRSRGKTPDQVLSNGSIDDSDRVAADPEMAPAHMAEHVLRFNEQLERILEMGLVLLIGAVLAPAYFNWNLLWFALVLFVFIRPLAVIGGLWKSGLTRCQTGLISWFGIRGVGSLYYLSYALSHGLPGPVTEVLVTITLMTIVLSIVVHGLSATPLMARYARANDQ
jgi:NhaP-type Na+/H+ or K+/H+ antiporter